MLKDFQDFRSLEHKGKIHNSLDAAQADLCARSHRRPEIDVPNLISIESEVENVLGVGVKV